MSRFGKLKLRGSSLRLEGTSGEVGLYHLESQNSLKPLFGWAALAQELALSSSGFCRFSWRWPVS